MKKPVVLLLLVLAVGLIPSGVASGAPLTGDSVCAKTVNTSLQVGNDFGCTPVGAGLEFSDALTNNIFDLDITDSQVIFALTLPTNFTGFFVNSGAHVNYLLTDLTKPFVSAVVNGATTVPAFNNGLLSISPQAELLVNFAGLGDGFFIPNGSRFVIDVDAQAPPVPEPASLAFLGAGLAAIGARRWHQRNKRV